MTKKNEKTLNWRLSELPTAGEVAELVDSEVITIEEAREILFSEASSSDEKVRALEEQLEYLRGLVETLSKNRSTTTYVPWTYTRTINTPSIYWADTNKILASSFGSISTATTSGSNGITMSVSDNTSGKILS